MTSTHARRPPAQRLLRRVRALIERYPQGGPMALAILVGLATGLGAVAFAAAIDLADYVFFDLLYDGVLGRLPEARLILIPAVGALLVAPTVMRYAPEARGPGVAEVLMSVETAAGRIRARVAAAKTVASAVTIGSGGSAGQEGPIVQIGAALGSAVGQALRLSEENVKLLLAAGSAGGIAAIFNAPIAGVFFALEVILRRFNIRNFSVVVLSAVVATTTAVAIRGDEPTIPVPPYELVSAVEIPLYAGLGVAAGLASVAFIVALYWTEDRFHGLRSVPPLLLPVLGGLMVGALGLANRDSLGLGYEPLEAALAGEMAATAMVSLLVFKLLTTSITIGSGGSGGVFGPSLVLGGMVGGAYGSLVHGLLPGDTATAGAYATVGMGAVVAGTARSPITAVLILFELTRDYGIILPVMTAVVVATLVSQLLSRNTIYTYKLARRGIHIDEDVLPVDLMQSLRVSDAMSPSLVTVAPDAPQAEVARALAGETEGLVMVVDDEGHLFGVITDTDLNETLRERGWRGGLTAADLCTRDVRTMYPDQTLHDALTVFAGHSIHALPVVLREQEGVPCGVLRRSDITNAYAAAIEERDALRRRGRLAPVTSGDDVRYLELRVARESVLNHHLLSEVRIPEDAVIVAIRRDGVTLIPRGHTRLEEGDRVTVIAARGAVDDVRAVFGAMPAPAPQAGRPRTDAP